MITNLLRANKRFIATQKKRDSFIQIHKRFADFTMIGFDEYIRNLQFCENVKNLPGAIVECGVWRGGMIAGIAQILGNKRNYYLFDSFEGLPPVKDIDGEAAKEWQSDKDSPFYFENCKAEIEFAQKAMSIALKEKLENVKFIKGWFNQTMLKENLDEPIALLRLDGDWYESTMTCLDFLFPYVSSNGIIIIDDYYAWDGCSKAVHDYLSKNKRAERIYQYEDSTAYIVKK